MTARRATPPGPIAPWAEIVPDAPYPMTIQDLLDWPDDDGYRYELVDGVLVRVAGSGDKATRLGLDIAAELRAYARPRRLGRATGADGVYTFPGAETGLIPDNITRSQTYALKCATAGGRRWRPLSRRRPRAAAVVIVPCRLPQLNRAMKSSPEMYVTPA